MVFRMIGEEREPFHFMGQLFFQVFPGKEFFHLFPHEGIVGGGDGDSGFHHLGIAGRKGEGVQKDNAHHRQDGSQGNQYFSHGNPFLWIHYSMEAPVMPSRRLGFFSRLVSWCAGVLV